MKTASSKVTVRMDRALKEQLEATLDNVGMNLTTGINVFARATVRCGGLPFEVADPSYAKEEMKPATSIQAATRFLAAVNEINKNGFTAEDEESFSNWDSGAYRIKVGERLDV